MISIPFWLFVILTSFLTLVLCVIVHMLVAASRRRRLSDLEKDFDDGPRGPVP